MTTKTASRISAPQTLGLEDLKKMANTKGRHRAAAQRILTDVLRRKDAADVTVLYDRGEGRFEILSG